MHSGIVVPDRFQCCTMEVEVGFGWFSFVWVEEDEGST